MSLPIISTPKYTLELPSSGTVIEYRPFLVKEERVLMIANETGDQTQILKAISDIISECTFGAINPKTLTSFDFEYVFLKLRAKSVGETTEIGLHCSSCDATSEVGINIDDICIDRSTVHTQPVKIQLTESIGVQMKYMNVDDMILLSGKSKSSADLTVDTLSCFIDSIYDETAVYPLANATREEISSFINSLNRSHLAKIESYIASIPKLQHTVSYKCKSCGCDNVTQIEGIASFFE